MPTPPPLPAAVLVRVLRIAKFDGSTLVFIAGGFGLISFAVGDWVGALVGGLAAGAGLIELHGRRRLQASDIAGMDWLVRSQIVLLTIIVSYVAYRFRTYDPKPMLEQIEHMLASAPRWLGLELPTLGEVLGMTKPQLLVFAKTSVRNAYIAVGVGSILCQGGLAYYYHRKRPTIDRALRKT